METRGFVYNPADSEGPKITNVKIDDITPDGYRVSCKVTDNVGVAKVEFPSWTSPNGQDDMVWTTGSQSGDTYTYYVRRSEHGGESAPYNTHICAYDYKGNESVVSAAAGLLVPKAMANLGDSTYFLMDHANQSWNTARLLCEWAYGGGHLVDIESTEEEAVLEKLVTSGGLKHYWIGASDAEAEGVWKWTSGKELEGGYTNWASGEPNGGAKENYAAFRKADLRWIDDDDDGGDSYGYIMEVEGFHEHNGTVTTDLPEGVYTVNASTNEGYVLDIAGKSKESKANLQLNSANGGDNQRFKFTLNGDGTYTITAVHSGLALDVYAGALNNDANVIQYTPNGTAAQRWYLEVTDDGYYSLRSKVNNLYIDIRYNDMADGTNVRTHEGNASTGQKFVLKRADDPKVMKSELLEVTPDGYKVRVELDAPQGIQKIRFPSWPISEGSDAAIWGTAPVVDNVAEYEVKVSDYKNRRGVYCTHVYVTDAFGKSHFVESFDNVLVPSSIASWSDSTYFLIDDWKSIADARKIANSQQRMRCASSHLAVIESAGEQAAIIELLQNAALSSYWIGASDEGKEGTWAWDTGSPVDYGNWAEGEPGGGTNENYAAADRNTGKWRDHSGGNSSVWGFIVELEGDDRLGPTVDDASVESVDDAGYTIRFKVSDPSGVGDVKVAAWADADGKGDLIEGVPMLADDGTYFYGVSTADHDGVGGLYHTRVTATDSLGNESVVDLDDLAKALVPDAAVDTGNAAYYRFDQPMTWTEAQRYVTETLADGMQLASVSSESDDDHIAALLAGGSKSAYWLGLADASAQGTFAWTDGTAADYTHWAAGQPGSSASARYAAVLASNSKWYAYSDAGVGGKTANMGFIAKLAYAGDDADYCTDEHAWGEWETLVKPTCSKAGLEVRYCNRCGYSESRDIAKLAHTAGKAIKENEHAATCSEEGSFDEVVYCSACGEELSREHKTTPAGTHTPTTDPAVAPTCTETGLTEGSHCIVCGEVLAAQETVPALGHHGIAVAAVAATCTDAGTTAGVRCDVCGEMLSSVEVVPALGHDYAMTVVAPTWDDEGYTVHKCSRCGDEYRTDTVPSLKEQSNSEQVASVQAIIDALPAPSELTLTNADDVKAARAAFDALSDEQRNQVDAAKLAAAEFKLSELQAEVDSAAAVKRASDAILALPDASDITLLDQPKVAAARIAYDALDEGQRAQLGAFALRILQVAESKVAALQEAADAAERKARDIANATVGVTNPTYTGKAVAPIVTVKANGTVLKPGADYSVAYRNSAGKTVAAANLKAAGSYQVVVTAAGDYYTGSTSKAFAIKPATVGAGAVAGVVAKTFTGKAVAQKPTVKVGGVTLKSGTDYTLSYQNAKGKPVTASSVKSVGSYKVVVKAKGNYAGTVAKAFKVNAAKVSKATFGKIAKQTLVKSGKAVTPSVVAKFGGATLKKGVDYTVTYKNNKKVGIASAIVKGKGNFTGSKTLTFKIVAKKSTKGSSALKVAGIR